MDMHPRGQACWHPPQPQHDFLPGSKFIFVENREKKVEGSAWSLCSGLPSDREQGEEGRENHEWTRMDTNIFF